MRSGSFRFDFHKNIFNIPENRYLKLFAAVVDVVVAVVVVSSDPSAAAAYFQCFVVVYQCCFV